MPDYLSIARSSPCAMIRSLRTWLAKPLIAAPIPAGYANLTAWHQRFNPKSSFPRDHEVLHDFAKNGTILHEIVHADCMQPFATPD